MITNIKLQTAISQLIEIFTNNCDIKIVEYISLIATIAIAGGLLAAFIGIFTSHKTGAKTIILVIIVAISAVFVIGQYFDIKTAFESAQTMVIPV